MKYKKSLVWVISAGVVAFASKVAFTIYNSAISSNLTTPLAQMSDDAVANTAGRLVAEGSIVKILAWVSGLVVLGMLIKAGVAGYKVYTSSKKEEEERK